MFCMGIWRSVRAHPEMLFMTTFEMLQQFAYMGFQIMTFLFLKHELQFSLYSAVALFHLFLGLSHVVSPLWSVLADEKLNKMRALMLATLLGFIGQVMVIIASSAPRFNGQFMFDPLPEGYPSFKTHAVWLTMVGLTLVGFGSGGARQISRALGADQFLLPAEERHLRNYYQLFFYFSAFGAVAGVLVAPVLRMQVECLDQLYCFPVSFGVSAFAILLSLMTLASGCSRLYRTPVTGSPFLETLVCVKTAWCAPADVPGSGLDRAGDVFTDEFIAEVRRTLRTLVLFIPLPLFWALLELQYSAWIYQGTRMVFRLLDKWHVEPDQIPVVSLLTYYVLMPILEALIVCCRLPRCPLLRMFFGSCLAVVAACMAMWVQLRIEPTLAYVPGRGEGRLMVWSGFYECGLETTIRYPGNNSLTITDKAIGLNYSDFRHLPVKGFQKIRIEFRQVVNNTDEEVPNCPRELTAWSRINAVIIEKQTVSMYLYQIFINPEGSQTFSYPPRDDLPFQDLDQCDLQLPKVFITYMAVREEKLRPPNRPLILTESENDAKNYSIQLPQQFHGVGPIHLHATKYDIVDNYKHKSSKEFERGGVYGLQTYRELYTPIMVKIVNASSSHGSWQFKQFIFVAAAKFFLPVTALEYSYQHVTVRMRPVLLSFWFISVALGNFIVAALASANIFDRAYDYYRLYAALMGFNVLVTLLCICNIKQMIYKDDPKEKSKSEDSKSEDS